MDSFYRALITSVQKDPVGLTQSPPFLCILTIFIELLISLFYIKLIKKPARILIWVIVANIISLPIVWFLIPWLLGLIFPGVTPVLLIIICELFAIFFEAYSYISPTKPPCRLKTPSSWAPWWMFPAFFLDWFLAWILFHEQGNPFYNVGDW